MQDAGPVCDLCATPGVRPSLVVACGAFEVQMGERTATYGDQEWALCPACAQDVAGERLRSLVARALSTRVEQFGTLTAERQREMERALSVPIELFVRFRRRDQPPRPYTVLDEATAIATRAALDRGLS